MALLKPRQHREVFAVSVLIEDERKKIAELGKLANPAEYTEEELLAKALEAKRAVGWCDVSTLQLGVNGNQRWAVVFHFHGKH